MDEYRCLVCSGVARIEGRKVDCSRCGKFQITREAEANLRSDGEPWPRRVSCWIRHTTLMDGQDVKLQSKDIERIKQSWRERNVSEKQDALLLALAKQSAYPGHAVFFTDSHHHVLAWAESEKEGAFHLKTLKQRGLVDKADTDITFVVTAAGWDRVAEICSKNPLSTDLVFVAMAFDPRLTEAWVAGLQPGIRDAGYRPERVDTKPHADKIDDRIMAMIREARFVVVDVTTQNRGAYFEAGFALGLNRPVIWSVRADEIGDVHFDTRQFNHIVWNDPAHLREQIRDRVLGVLGRGPNTACSTPELAKRIDGLREAG